MNTIFDIELTDDDFQNTKYNFQPALTKTLDFLDSDFDQSIINEIVLWKVSRYSKLDVQTIELLNKITKINNVLDEDLTKDI
ncbi:hypothetical protein [Kaistella jeonii]|uniref:hypothetical protein n=1 Tax=Kaistella jeonii TaxID=266749 RepID=UPI00068FA8D1|nr:hypothetical protein [Kaistella jeonii]SFB86252.1 hypothetical protein SAMN05421876_10396 [Kaistella jeonii]VEI96023.1 Uncharacterised protein [Kaistella jeonii]